MKARHQWESIVERVQEADFAGLDPDLCDPILYAHELIEDQSNELGRRHARIKYLEARLANIEYNRCEGLA